jgi:hypothetical protein
MVGSHKPILLKTNEKLKGRLNYIHQNPVAVELRQTGILLVQLC